MRLRTTAGALFAAGILLSGCGGDSEPVNVATSSSVVAQPDAEISSDTADVEAIRSTFERYREVLLAQDGDGVIAVLSPNTVAHYEHVAQLARAAGPEEIAGSPLIDRLMIARLRVEMPPEQLASLTGDGLLRYGVDEGLIDASSVAENGIGDISIDGDRGYGEMLVGSQPAGADWEFVKAGSDWTFDLAAGFPLANEALAATAADAGMTDDEFIFEAVHMVTGLPVDASIYERP